MVHAATLMRGLPVALLLAASSANAVDVPEATRGANITRGIARTSEICEARTINYITHALPQSCLTSSWKNPSPTSVAPTSAQPATDAPSRQYEAEHTAPPSAKTALDHNATEVQVPEPAATTFMSFEDWKEMMLRRAGQDPQELRSRKPSEPNTDDRYPPDTGHAGLGEEGEISLNFEHYGEGMEKGITSSRSTTAGDSVDQRPVGDNLLHEEGKAATVHLSKDAGKTCKERFSYSSFDAGATILKTSPGAKNARAILVENKDSYMLLECDASSKYVIVELSDDISVDTVVLANFEFFSSMVRHFRISVSDRYPVKMDKWRELGTFEARNSRDIQPFLVENPQIWAKYVRIEFLTHFGNEYYCPISLLRIHGSRMLDSWKDSESGRDDDTLIDGDESSRNDAHEDESQVRNAHTSESEQANLTSSTGTSPWTWTHGLSAIVTLNPTCPVSYLDGIDSLDKNSSLPSMNPTLLQEHYVASTKLQFADSVSQTRADSISGGESAAVPNTMSAKPPPPTTASNDDRVINTNETSSATVSNTNTTTSDRHQNVTTTAGKASASNGQNGKPRSSGTAGASAASPTMQEGFFNAITKRLQHVESNLTLSMKYVEDQSKHVQEALQSREQKQQAKISHFLDELNKTVLSELHNVREQYDQIWQSTVLALESQRDRSERDMMALSTRLNLLADEVVFQKRMAIVQAIILLSCLFLIIFSRGVSLPSLAPLLDQACSSTCPTPTSPATPRPSSYQANKGHHTEIEPRHASSDPADEVRIISPGGDRDVSSSAPAPFEAISFHGSDDPSLNPAAFQRLSPPLTPNQLDETSISDDDSFATGSNYKVPRRVGGLSHMNSRKPLPSLPEHPRSLNEA